MLLRKSIALGGLMFERQTNALVLRGRCGEHPLPALLQSVAGRPDARVRRGFSVKNDKELFQK